MEELTGKTFGKYELLGHLGTGGMARVYKAYQSNLDRHVALKVMHSYLAEDEEFVGRFKQEAAAVARLRHSNIVKVHDFDVIHDQLYYMVMEYIDGPTLKDEMATREITDSPFTLSEVTQIMSSLANAIDYAHARGMVHRDVKPANIMFTADGHVILTDFGIVRMIGATYNTNTGFLAGTPAYMSPEQGRGERGSALSDIYALGVILFELLTGKPPFESDTPLGLIKQHIEVPPPPLANFNEDMPLELEGVLQKVLAKEPADRYQNTSKLVKALQKACDVSANILLKPPPVKTLALPAAPINGANLIVPAKIEVETAVITSPYCGLFAFSEKDAPHFFGRESFTEQLIDAVQQQTMVAVIGPSGSGKSSVVLAGLLPYLRQQSNWDIAVMRPGSDPFQSLAATCVRQLEPGISDTQQLTRTGELAQALRQKSISFSEIVDQIIQRKTVTTATSHRFLLVVDQFEEIYTLCNNRQMRHQFLNELLDLADVQRFWLESTFTLVFTLRTDFLGRALRYRPFADALQGTDIKLGPMNRRELGRAIASPARRQGLGFETGLVARILDDVGDEPGNLPLLEFALTSLWENRDSPQLSHTAYEKIGTVEGALARHADSVFALMSPAEKVSARQIFIQMVRPGSGTEDTRRLATRDELGENNWKLVRQLADARLVVTSQNAHGQETVEVVHEALIRGWDRLRDWMDEDRTFRAWQERLRSSLEQWSIAEQDEGALLRGLPLTEAESWAIERHNFLSRAELAFIQKSINAVNREKARRAKAAEEQRKIKEQERIERQRAEENARRAEDNARNARRLTWLAGALVVFVVIALIAAYLAVISGQTATNNAATAVANEQVADDARQLAENALETSDANAILLATAEHNAANEAVAAGTSASAAVMAQETAVSSAVELATAVTEAEISAEEAENARQEAEKQSRLAISSELAEAAKSQLTSDPQLALLLALEAANITIDANEETPASTQDALYQALFASQLRFTLSGHTDQLTTITFSPDGSRIATAGRDQTAKVWDAVAGQELFTLEQHTRAINSIVYSPDGEMLATGGDDGFVILWNAEFGTRISVLNSKSPVKDMAFNPDGSRLATVNGDGTVRIWNINARDSLFKLFDHRVELTAVTYNPSGSRFATAGKDSRVVIWNAETGSPLSSIDLVLENVEGDDPINNLAYSPDGTQLITAHESGVARLWDAQSSEFLMRLTGHASTLTDVNFSPDGSRIITASADGTAKVWEAATGQALFTLIGHVGGITAVSFSPDSATIATASQDASARIWNSTGGLDFTILSGHREPVIDIEMSDDSTIVVTGGQDNTARVWNSSTGAEIQQFAGHNGAIHAIDLNSAGTHLATASEDFNVRLWHLTTREVNFLEHQAPVYDVVFHEDDHLLATASGSTCRIWDVGTRRVVARFVHDIGVRAIAFHPNNAHIAVGDEAGHVILWDIEEETAVLTLVGHNGRINGLAFNHDGTMLATASNDSTVILWNTSNGDIIRTFAEHAGAVLSVTFNQDGTRLATGSADKSVKLWDPNTSQSLQTYSNHTSTVHAVAFNPTGNLLATASADRTAQLIPLDNVETLFNQGMTLRERLLTSDECAQFLRGRPCVTLNP